MSAFWPRKVDRMISVEVFLRNPNPYLREFRRKRWKTPKGKVDKRDLELNQEPPVYLFWAQNRSTTDRTKGIVLKVTQIVLLSVFTLKSARFLFIFVFIYVYKYLYIYIYLPSAKKKSSSSTEVEKITFPVCEDVQNTCL